MTTTTEGPTDAAQIDRVRQELWNAMGALERVAATTAPIAASDDHVRGPSCPAWCIGHWPQDLSDPGAPHYSPEVNLDEIPATRGRDTEPGSYAPDSLLVFARQWPGRSPTIAVSGNGLDDFDLTLPAAWELHYLLSAILAKLAEGLVP